MSLAVVTGATGFLGTNLVRALIDEGFTVRAFGLPGSQTRWIEGLPGVEIVLGDVTAVDDLDRVIPGAEVVFHVAGDTSFWRRRFARQRHVNVEGSALVADACVRHGVRRLVHTSTVDALGYDPDGIADETWSRYTYEGWSYNYADTKREGERRVLEATAEGLEVVVIYPGSMLGPFDYTLQFGRLFCELRDGKVPGCPCGGVGFGHVVDVAQAHVAAATRGRSGEGYICAGVNTTYRELFDLIARKVGAKAPRFDLPRSLMVGYGHLMELWSRVTHEAPDMNPGMARFMSIRAYYDCSKAERELAYRVRPLQQMVDDAYDWYVEHGMLE